jgi:hypothetical protein
MRFASGVPLFTVTSPSQRTELRSQGIQVMNDTASFGSFVNSLLVSLRDEYVKLPSLNFPFMSDAVPRHIEIDDVRADRLQLRAILMLFQVSGTRKVINDAQYLRSLSDLSSMSIPIQSPSTWIKNSWTSHLNVDVGGFTSYNICSPRATSFLLPR